MNLYIAGTANVPLFSQQSIFKNDFINGLPSGIKPYMTLILILVLTIICKILLDLYMQTKSGYLLRAVGDNHVLVASLAKDQGNVKILGLAISNGLVSLADRRSHGSCCCGFDEIVKEGLWQMPQPSFSEKTITDPASGRRA